MKRAHVVIVGLIALALSGCSSSATNDSSPTPTESFYMDVNPDDVNYYNVGDGYQAALNELPSPGNIPSCADAFSLAASVPPSETNDAEMYRTGRYCENVDQWQITLVKYPAALGVEVTALDAQYVHNALVALCNLEDAEYTLTCRDALQKGML